MSMAKKKEKQMTKKELVAALMAKHNRNAKDFKESKVDELRAMWETGEGLPASTKQAKVVNTSGKRKTAIARATVKPGKGRVRVNSEPIEILQPEMARNKAMEPLTIAGAMNRLEGVDIIVNTTGGGQMGQVDAIRTAIARGLVHYNDGAEGIDEELRDEFLRFDRSLLVNDPRRKEPKHQMGRGARAKWQKSYR
jgi:small subunit ribosomal protein S9